MVKRVLMIAFHYPPVQGSSGVQRTLKFSHYLPDHGWEPLVLTAHPRAYLKTHPGQLREISETLVVRRAFALDASRHLAIRGAYPSLLALPDRWSSWLLGAVPAGLSLIRRHRPRLIWSTYPIATAHLIGFALHRLTGVPWIADFRDSMTEEHYPSNPGTRRVYRWIEERAVKNCRFAVFTTRGAARMYAERYPDVSHNRWKIVPNGYDEENFLMAEKNMPARKVDDKRIVLLHSGLLYPSERDPGAFFAALRELLDAGKVSPETLQVVLRASGHDDYYGPLLQGLGLNEIVGLEPPIPYQEALVEMLSADGLMIFQASNCNHQIPAKIYEYLRARRPIIALTDPEGDTADVLRSAGLMDIIPLDSKERIMGGLMNFISAIREKRVALAGEGEVARHSRRERTRELAALFDSAG